MHRITFGLVAAALLISSAAAAHAENRSGFLAVGSVWEEVNAPGIDGDWHMQFRLFTEESGELGWVRVQVEGRKGPAAMRATFDTSVCSGSFGTTAYAVGRLTAGMLPRPRFPTDLVGFWAYPLINRTSLAKSPVKADMREWHTYGIIWEEDGVAFLVDGDVVASTDAAPSEPHRVAIFFETMRFGAEGDYWTGDLRMSQVMGLKQDGWIQVDYVRLFATEERFDGWSEEISQLLSRTDGLVEEVKKKGTNTTQLEAEYAKARDLWREDHYNYLRARESLSELADHMKLSLQHWDEVCAMFSHASQLIEEATLKGMDTKRMESDYVAAEGLWAECDSEIAKWYLQRILDKEPEIPEPALLSILSLVLLPAFLRRGGRSPWC